MKALNFDNNSIALADKSQYVEVEVDAGRVLESWRHSLMSFEWLDFRGNLKALEEMPETERAKRLAAQQKIQDGGAFMRPILGIGIQDNVEIGSGRADFLTLAAAGYKTIPVHIRKSQIKDFKAFLADISS